MIAASTTENPPLALIASNLWIAVKIMMINAGDGPLMVTFPLLIKVVISPPTIAAISPAIGGAPAAIATPSANGKATNDTLKPATKSLLQLRRANLIPEFDISLDSFNKKLR
jgi:hypothetical protein